MAVRVGATSIAQIKVGATTINSIRFGATLAWSASGIRDDFDRQDQIGMGASWTDLGPATTPNMAGISSRGMRMQLEDVGTTLAAQTSHQLYNAAVTDGDDGWVECVTLSAGDKGALYTTIWRRADTSLTNAVGVRLRPGSAQIVSRISSTEVLRGNPIDMSPGDTARLEQVGNVHTLSVSGSLRTGSGSPKVGLWNDTGGLASKGASFRSMAATVMGQRDVSRLYSPALEYIECG